MASQKPLLLKDYLKLDPFLSDSCSGSDPLRTKKQADKSAAAGFTTVRFLLEAERTGGASLLRSRSKNALSDKISAVINAVKNLQALSSPTRSKKPSRRFWKKKKNQQEEEEPKITVKDIVQFSSFNSLCFCPSPVVSSCCETGTSSTDDSHHRQLESQTSSGCQSEEEKEQLSPVSVMDFPNYDDDDDGDDNQEENDEEEGAKSDENFEENIAAIERTTHHLLQKILRFESLAELEPVDLAQRFEDEDGRAAPSGNEVTAWQLIRRLRSDALVAGPHEKLLVDFFNEGLPAAAEVEALLSAAGGWIDGGSRSKGEDEMKEMERNGRWRSFESGRDDVASDVEAGVLGSLLHELVLDLVCC